MPKKRVSSPIASGSGWAVRQLTLEDDLDTRVVDIESPGEVGVQRLDGGKRLRVTMRATTWSEIVSQAIAAEILGMSVPPGWEQAFQDAYFELIELTVSASDEASPMRRVFEWMIANGYVAKKENVLWAVTARALGAGPRLMDLANQEGGKPLLGMLEVLGPRSLVGSGTSQ